MQCLTEVRTFLPNVYTRIKDNTLVIIKAYKLDDVHGDLAPDGYVEKKYPDFIMLA